MTMVSYKIKGFPMIYTLKQNAKDLFSPLEVDSSDYTLKENLRVKARDWLGFKGWEYVI